MAAGIYKYRQELLEMLPRLGVINGLGVLLLYAALWPWAVAPKQNKKVCLAPSKHQKIYSRGCDDVLTELLVVSRRQLKPGRYLASSDGKHWHWFCFSFREDTWHHEVHSSGVKPETRARFSCYDWIDVVGRVLVLVMVLLLVAVGFFAANTDTDLACGFQSDGESFTSFVLLPIYNCY